MAHLGRSRGRVLLGVKGTGILCFEARSDVVYRSPEYSGDLRPAWIPKAHK